MGQFLLVHVGTGTVISAGDGVYALDVTNFPGPLLDQDDTIVELASKRGYEIDNYNLTNFFYGSDHE
jgi:hypothetical protein